MAQWARLSDLKSGDGKIDGYGFYGLDPSKWSWLGSKNLTLESVEQRGLGDCYYLSTLAEYARYPNRWAQYAVGHDWNKGFASFRYFVGGEEIQISVDDYIPFHTYEQYKVFLYYFDAVGPWGALWAVMAEKSYAKLNFNYVNIIGGNFCPVHTDLYGLPCHIYHPKDFSLCDLWEKINNATQKGWFLSSGTSSGSNADSNEYGIVLGHQYTLIGAYKCSDTGEKIIKLRNPWGSHKYSAWKKDSTYFDGISDACRKEHDCEQNQALGIFCTNVQIYNASYSSFSIAPWEDEYVRSSYSVDMTKNSGAEVAELRFNVSTPGEYYIGAQFPTSRMSGMCGANPKLKLKLVDSSGKQVGETVENEAWFVFGSSEDPAYLEAGSYAIQYQLTTQKCDTVKTAGVYVYGPAKVELENYVPPPPTPSELVSEYEAKCAKQKLYEWYGVKYNNFQDGVEQVFCFKFEGKWGCKEADVDVTLYGAPGKSIGMKGCDVDGEKVKLKLIEGDKFTIFTQQGQGMFNMGLQVSQCS